jgi:hypothetical protein
VKIGSGKRSLSFKPVGSAMPQTVPLLRYSFQPDRHDFRLAAVGRASGEHLEIDARGQRHLFDIGRDEVIRHAEPLEPKRGDLREHFALVGNAGGKHPIERA